MAFVAGVLGFFAILIVGLAIVQFRRITPNAYRCRHCETYFSRPAHHAFPDHCPRCGARDWAILARRGVT